MTRGGWMAILAALAAGPTVGAPEAAYNPAALPPPAPLTGAALRALSGPEGGRCNLRRDDFLRVVTVPRALDTPGANEAAADWLKAAYDIGFRDVIVPVYEAGFLHLGDTVLGAQNPSMVVRERGIPMSALKCLTTAMDNTTTGGGCPGMTVWAKVSVGSLDVGAVDALPSDHPVRKNDTWIRPSAQGMPLTLDLGAPGYGDMLTLLVTELAQRPRVEGIILDGLAADPQQGAALAAKLAKAAQAARPGIKIAVRTDGGAAAWQPGASAAQLASAVRTAGWKADRWFHAFGSTDGREAVGAAAASAGDVALVAEVGVGPAAANAAQVALDAVTDPRCAGLVGNSAAADGIATNELASFRSLLKPDAVEARVFGGLKAGSVRSAESGVRFERVAPAPMPAAPAVWSAPGDLPAMTDQPAGDGLPPLGGDASAPLPMPSLAPAPAVAVPPPATVDAPPATPVAVEPAPVAAAPAPSSSAKNGFSGIVVPTPRPAVFARRWRGITAVPATDADSDAVRSMARPGGPSASARFVLESSAEVDSPFLPRQQPPALIDYASRDVRKAAAKQAAEQAPLLKITTTTGRTFTGKARQVGGLWRIELPSGGVVNLPVDRVESAVPANN